MITGRDLIESQKLYSTGDDYLDELLERAFSEGYEYAQREFSWLDSSGSLIGSDGRVRMTRAQLDNTKSLFTGKGKSTGLSKYDPPAKDPIREARKARLLKDYSEMKGRFGDVKKVARERTLNEKKLLTAKKPLSRLPSSTSTTMPGITSINYNYK